MGFDPELPASWSRRPGLEKGYAAAPGMMEPVRPLAVYRSEDGWTLVVRRPEPGDLLIELNDPEDGLMFGYSATDIREAAGAASAIMYMQLRL